MNDSATPATVVVGIDGSRAAVAAAAWAVDEAVSRDIPLRLVCAVDQGDDEPVGPEEEARRLAGADVAVRCAFSAVEATDKPVKIEVEIIRGHPVGALMRASRSAAMVCVGAVGYRHFQPGQVGSTAAAVAADARRHVLHRAARRRRTAPAVRRRSAGTGLPGAPAGPVAAPPSRPADRLGRRQRQHS